MIQISPCCCRYCHRTGTNQEMELTKTVSEMDALRRCSVVNWLEYFQFRVPSVVLPEGEAHRFVEVRTANCVYSEVYCSIKNQQLVCWCVGSSSKCVQHIQHVMMNEYVVG